MSSLVMEPPKRTERIFREYEERLVRRGRQKASIKTYHRAVHYFERWLNENEYSIEDLHSELVEDYFAGLLLAPATKRLHFVHIRAAFKYAHERAVVPFNPTVDVQLERVPDKIVNVLSSRELQALLDVTQTEPERVLLSLAIFTGMRRFEIVGLTWDNVDLANRTIRVIGKGGKYRIIPIHPALGEVLAEADKSHDHVVAGPRGGSSTYTADRWLQRLSERAGVKARFHDFRRTFASSLDANGVQQLVIEDILGWAKNGIFAKHYRNVASQRLHDAILCVYADAPVRP